MVMSLIRAAGILPISTVAEPSVIMPGPPGTQPGSAQGADISLSRAAGMLPIMTVGNPVKLSDSPTEVQRSPLLGEHTEEILGLLGYGAADLAQIKASGAITAPEKPAKAEAA